MPLCIVAGAGPGMGASIAQRFAREGYDVALLARDSARLEKIAAPMRTNGHTAATYSVDLCDLSAVADAYRTIRSTQGDADVLVYNGARWHEAPAITLDPMTFNWDIALCATGALASAQHVYPAMKARQQGTILFTGGGLALHPEWGSGVASLSAGKAALRALSYALADELKGDNIHVASVTIAGAVAPGTALDPDRIAENYWRLHSQARNDWQSEIVVAASS